MPDGFPPRSLNGPDATLRAVSDGRSAQGRDHPVAVVLTLRTAAVLAGMCSFTAIAGWVADVPAELLAQLHGRPTEFSSKTTFLSNTTLWRMLTGAAPPRWTLRSAPGAQASTAKPPMPIPVHASAGRQPQ